LKDVFTDTGTAGAGGFNIQTILGGGRGGRCFPDATLAGKKQEARRLVEKFYVRHGDFSKRCLGTGMK